VTVDPNTIILILVTVIQGLVAVIGLRLEKQLNANTRGQNDLARMVDKLTTAVLGMEGQGGLTRLVDELCDRVTALEKRLVEVEKLIPLYAQHDVTLAKLMERVDAAERILERVRDVAP
jgi:hypothetical protein